MKKGLILIGFMFSITPLFSQIGHNVEMLYRWDDTTITHNLYGDKYSDVWGFVQNGREYAVMGSTHGTHVFDVTDPTNTYLVDFELGGDNGRGIVHRDYKVYKNYLYAVCDEGSSTLQIFDLKFLPDSLFKVYDDHALFPRAHNIFIDTSSAILYACAYTSSGKALSIFSVEKPWSPQPMISYFNTNGIEHVHDLYVRHDTAYLNCGKAGLLIVDFTDPRVPKALGSLTTYPDQGYNHNGWLDDTGNTYIFSDETPGAEVKICDVSDIDSIRILSTIPAGPSDTPIAHNVFIKDDFLYMASYHDGLQIFDISNPQKPIKTGSYDTYNQTDPMAYRGAWGVYPFLPSGIILVSDMNTGLYVFDVQKAIGNPEVNIETQDFLVYPNPVTSTVHISFMLKRRQQVSIELFDIQGKKVAILKEGYANAGEQSYGFDVESLPSNVYFVTLKTDNQIVTKKLVKLD